VVTHPNGKIGPNTTASPKARSKTLGPNGSFPAGDKKHQRLAIQMAPKSYAAGNISRGTEKRIQSEARTLLKKKK
jgi:hypothetical protein